MIDTEFKDLALNTLTEMTSLLGYQAAVTPTEKDDALLLEVAMDNAGRLIGNQGRTLEALELLLNRILRKNDEKTPWVAVSVDGYTTGQTGGPDRRVGHRMDDDEVQRFEHIALDAAKEVKHWKSPKKLGPYMPAERRVIHTALKGDADIVTESIPAPESGDRMKFVLIKLAE